MQGNGLPRWLRKSSAVSIFLLANTAVLWCADSPAAGAAAANNTMAGAIGELQQQVRELREAVAEVRSEAARYRAETMELRRELQATKSQLSSSSLAATPPPAAPSPAPAAQSESAAVSASQTPSTLEDRVAALEENSHLLNGKVDDQYQTKVESASKYRLRLSGILLLNLFSNRGNTDNQDIPGWAIPAGARSAQGNFGATLRQSEIGLEVFGPRVAGARASGNLQFDFAGGFPATVDGVNFGIARLRIASMRLDWDRTSIVAGQDPLFVSPLSPASFASLAVPTFAYSGNLWGWIPQVRVEHRFDLSNGQSILLQGGILDNLDGEQVVFQSNRVPQAGERSSQPAYGTRIAWTRQLFGQPLTLGVGGYYGRQDWGLDRYTDGWAGMTDWQLPLSPWLSLSGEFYRGRGVGGLGGALGRSVLFSGDPTNPYTQIRALNSLGGWSQLKIRATPKLEFNGAVSVDNPFAEDLRGFPVSQSYINPSLSQNRGALINFVYRPRSDLLFSSEYRHLRTFQIQGTSQTAEQINLMMGILF